MYKAAQDKEVQDIGAVRDCAVGEESRWGNHQQEVVPNVLAGLRVEKAR
jgi:hypothetical protein